MRIRSGLVNLIYKKALVLSSEERGRRPTGDIVNLASVDAIRLQDLCTYGLIAFSGPFQVDPNCEVKRLTHRIFNRSCLHSFLCTTSLAGLRLLALL
jgi:hypothetical protein